MSKSDEIKSWISGSSTPVDDAGDDEVSTPQAGAWRKDRIQADWSQAMEHAHSKLTTSSTKTRITFLREELYPLVKCNDLSLSQIMDIFKLLTCTCPRYVDSPSRDAVEDVGMELVRRDELRGTSEPKFGVAEQVLGWLLHQVDKIVVRGSASSHAASELFVLLSWSCGLYSVCLAASSDFTMSEQFKTVVTCMALLLSSILDPSSSAKPSLRKSASIRTQHSLRSSRETLPILISTLVALAKAGQTPLAFIPLLGTSVDVAVKLEKTDEPALSLSNKSDIIGLYNSAIIMSKFTVPVHVATALNNFIRNFISEHDIATILSTMEKALLRSPEHSLSVVAQFFHVYPRHITSDVFRRLLTPTLNSAKSSNPLVRAHSVELFKVLMDKNVYDTESKFSLEEIIALPKAGKTAGPDHRFALYSMLLHLKPSSTVSPIVIQSIPPLILKESQENPISILASALPVHMIFHLKCRNELSSDTLSVIGKEMASSKPILRRSFASITGAVLWHMKELNSPASLAFAQAVLPSLDTYLKNVVANPLSSSASPLEGYIAAALFLGPLSDSGKFDYLSKNPTISSLAQPSSKSFFFWDKVYQKITKTEDEIWLLRVCEAMLSHFYKEVSKSEQLRIQIGSTFLHFAVESKAPEVRKSCLAMLQHATHTQPELINRIVKDTLLLHVQRAQSPSTKVQVHEDDVAADDSHQRQGRLSAFLSSCSLSGELDTSRKDKILVDLFVLAHHPLICGDSRQLWIEYCQKSGADPRDIVNRNADAMLESILKMSEIPALEHATYRAVTTCAFVSAEVILPRLMEQFRLDLDSKAINGLTDFDLNVWATPEGQTFVDVLSLKKEEVVQKKGKDADIAKWEAELRKSIANKKASANSSLSKHDEQLVRAQLQKESQIRAHVNSVKSRLERGLHLIRSVISARVEEFQVDVFPVISLLLDGPLRRGSVLVGQKAFDTFLQIADCTSERLESYRKWVGIAALRSLAVDMIPDELQAELLNLLVIRVLYRLRTLSEQTPFDVATFAYSFSLLREVLNAGGLQSQEEDEALEQMVLSLDILKFHAGEFSNPSFPRAETMAVLLNIIKQQPKLSKDASSILIDVAQAIHAMPSPKEIQVLLDGTLLQEAYVRNSCLQALQPFDLTEWDWSIELWVGCHDDDEQNSRLAHRIWDDNGLDVPERFLEKLLPFLGHEHAYVRTASAAAIADAAEYWPQMISDTVSSLQNFYREMAKVLAPEYDAYGMVISDTLNRTDPWPTRLAIAHTFEALGPSFLDSDVVPFFRFLIEDGALGDRYAEVRRGMLGAGTTVIDLHGLANLAELIKMFEDYLAAKGVATESGDQIKEAVVILFGRIARHLNGNDPRIPGIVDRLIGALSTPAEQVQMAVSECLAPLVKVIKPVVGNVVDRLLQDLFDSPKYAARRGAAYGLAGVIKGTGIGGMKDFDIINRLKAGMDDKKRYEPRQGCMFAFETLSATLGRLFEPYVIHILPLLLTAFGDGSPDVREATQDAARVIMSNMSGYGVKSMLPSLLSGLDEKQWRSKKGSIELLGMMAYCSPRQLSVSLPIVIPRLTGVLTDSHAQVRTAANKSLKQFGEVISNPEIQALVPVLLKALVDPTKTPNALTSMLKTSFMHYIDQSSLALVIPIIERGLRERGSDVKRKATQIVGNLASLTDSKDFVPYLDELIPMVHAVLVDPVPEARATAAKALGTLVERLGEGHFPDLVPGLLRTLKTDTSGVDRQGAAQGLSEVLSGLGMERLEGLLPDIIANAQSPRSTVREGFMSLLVFLPATFGNRFQPHLPKIIGPILSGLSDIEEYVREAAMRAGRMIVTNYSSKAIDLLLPELENGMFDPGWRIRQASITLVGELLFKVSGISGKAEIETEEDIAEASTAETSRRALVEVLGPDRRDRILTSLYLARQDSVNVVRQSSIHIWKALVHNTPRTVREMLPEVVGQIVTLISGDDAEQQETAARTMAELCRKFGEKTLGDIIPILHNKLSSPDARTREGVCLAICEILENAGENQREGHEDEIISMVRKSLVDDEANVRSSAAKAFDILQDSMGAKAIDQTIPTLLEALRQPGASSGTALQALREVMSVRAGTVFPILIPTLTALPMTVFNARALASLVTVAGNALSRRLTVILNSLVKVFEEEPQGELREAVEEALRALFASISDPEGLNTLMLLLLGWVRHESPKRRVCSCEFFIIYCEVSEMEDSLYRVDWIRQLVSLFEDHEIPVHTAAWRALDVFVKTIPKDELETLVVPLRRAIEGTGNPGDHVYGFSLPKGVSPLVPIVIAGLTTGSNEQREQAAYAIADLVERTEENAIKPFVVPFTGPLIRVATQATTYPPGVKTAILSALLSMLERIPAFVKPFFPQLQRTFVKSASDPSSAVVRTKAAQALGVLMKNQPRVDPVVTELIAGATASDDGIGSSLVLALANVVHNGGENIGPKALEAAAGFLSDVFKDPHDEPYYQSAAPLFAALSSHAELVKPIINAHFLAGTPPSIICSLSIVAVFTPPDYGEAVVQDNVFKKLAVLRSVAQKVKESIANDKPSVARPAREARDLMKASNAEDIAGVF